MNATYPARPARTVRVLERNGYRFHIPLATMEEELQYADHEHAFHLAGLRTPANEDAVPFEDDEALMEMTYISWAHFLTDFHGEILR